MNRRTLITLVSVVVVSVGLAVAATAARPGPALLPGKPGGVLNVLTREDLAQGFSIHESVTLSTIWPAQPCFNNLVTFDDDYAHRPHVKNLIPHHSVYSYGRMQEVWLDR